MKYKLVAIDMDGTLLNSNNQVSERTKVIIEKAKNKGTHIVLSTGRVLKSALSYSRSLNLKNPIVACNGAIIVDENANIIYKKPIDNSLVKEIVNLAMKKNIYYHFYDESRFYSHVKVDEVLQFYNEGNGNTIIDIKVFQDIEEIIKLKDLNVYKFLFIDDNRAKLQDLRMDLDKLGNIGTSSSWANNIEAMGLNVSKGEALRELCNRLKIMPEEVIAIGDSENDLSMLTFAGLGVAMGNGDEFIKKEADYITDSNDEDGVAKVIEKFVLE
ncbi:Cof-type HAD-IIB family hydrolase [Tissierella carlieri]|jgi:Cof subfamily protein (haloacid dehalogenase superfamily)|uniref:Cof-type HAD-IIB family hydrolase n=1 Tax=Tissierella carlieri TaxID=689904 RepID=UPI001C108BA9|nr:Cof-type HAD-IIB family hydrolase [Tissierella carlieri]MBU5312502.1 Cof-type HAD-IIB family hydrolase [Tissierella carlieri]MDU5081768.1 Cof-type HAD-IIB family hydrolase [Bacillota bacterium]